jgi:hypothetical protein
MVINANWSRLPLGAVQATAIPDRKSPEALQIRGLLIVK